MQDTVVSKSYNRAAKPELGYLLLVFGAILLLSFFTLLFITPLLRLFIRDENYLLITIQLVTPIVVFFFSAWVTEFYFRRRHFTYLYRVKREDVVRSSWWIPLVVYLLSIPVVGVLAYTMEQIPAPGFLDGVFGENEGIEQLMEAIFGDKRPLSVVLTFLALVVVTPVAEEILFRGAIQGWLLARVRNPHMVVGLVGLIFSLVHAEWDGILARWFMGALLGYMALYGGIYLAIASHALNNLVAVVSYYTMSVETLAVPESTTDALLGTGLSAVALVGIYLIVKKMKTNLIESKQHIENTTT